MSLISHSGLLRRFARNQRGNTAAFFAVGSLALFGAVGGAVDYSRGNSAQTRATAAADAAALAGVQAVKAYLSAPSNLSADAKLSKARDAGQDAAKKHFLVATADIKPLKNLTVDPKVVIASQGVTSTVSFSGEVPMSIGAMLGKSTFQIKNTVIANGGGGQYLDVHVVMDHSASMGVGATLTDINAMLADPGMFPLGGYGCAFACHVGQEGGYIYNSDDYAKTKGYTLRIDVLKSAVQSMLALADGTKINASQYQFSLYAFANRLTVMKTATTDYAGLNSALSGLRLTQTDGGTNFGYVLGTEVAGKIPAVSGTGSSATDRKTVVVLVTDGVENSLDRYHADGSYTVTDPSKVVDWTSDKFWGHYLDANFTVFPSWTYTAFNGSTATAAPYNDGDFKVQALNPAICDKLKSKGATVAVLYVIPSAPGSGYTGMYSEIFNYITTEIQAGANSTLARCASDPTLFAKANSPAEITTALKTLFETFAGGKARLTK